MRALFLTTPTSDCDNHVAAWESFAGPCDRLVHDPNVETDESAILLNVGKPDVVFYIGAAEGRGVPSPRLFQLLREIAPTVNLCSDSVDSKWKAVLTRYSALECFDLQAGIDGVFHDAVDMATVTPVNPSPFENESPERSIPCGFIGSVGQDTPERYANEASGFRARTIRRLNLGGYLQLKRRDPSGQYADYVRFMKQCRVMLNVSWCGSGEAHQIKGRVMEAGWAGCCLLESSGSPIATWFPDDCYLLYDDYRQAADLLRNTPDDVIERTARRLSEEVREKYHPSMIYGEILGLVDRSKSVAAA